MEHLKLTGLFFKILFIDPMGRLAEWAWLKALVATFMALFATPHQYVAVFVFLWFLDLLMGTFKSVIIKKQSWDVDKVLFSVGKFGAYSVFLIAASFFGNAFEWPEIQKFAFAFVSLTEFASITRHAFGPKAGQVLRGIQKVIGSKVNASMDAAIDMIGNEGSEK